MAVNELITKRRHFDIDKVLHNYNIDKKSHEAEKTFIEVAKLIAQREPLLFLDNFEKFELTDQEILVDITKSMILTGSKDQASY